MTKSISYYARKKTSKLFGVICIIAGTSLFAMPSAMAEQVGATVVCSDGTNEQSYQIGWDNTNQFFANKGSISHLFCEGGYAQGHNTFVSSTISGPADYYNGVAPEPQPTPQPQPTPEQSASPTEQPSPQPEPTVEPTPEPSPVPSVTETSTAVATPSPTPTSQQETATATVEPIPSPSVEPTPSTSPEPTPVPPSPQPTPIEQPAVEPQATPEPEPQIEPSLTPDQVAAIEAARVEAEKAAAEAKAAEEAKIAAEQAAIAAQVNDAIAQAIQDNGGEVPVLIVSEPEVTLPVTPEVPAVDETSPIEESQPESPTETVDETVVEPPVEATPTPEPKPEPVVEPISPEPPATIVASNVDLSKLAPNTPVALDNGVVVTAEVAIAVELLQDPAEMLATIFTNPLAALDALSNVGADLPPEVRKKAEKVVVAAVIAGNIATSAALSAASPAASYRRKP